METGEVTQVMQDNLKLLETLHEIASSSSEAEIVRMAMSALTNTPTGLQFLQVHPLVL